MKQKKFVSALLIGVIILVVIGGYFVFFKQTCRLESPPDLYVCGSNFSHFINSFRQPVSVNPTQIPNINPTPPTTNQNQPPTFTGNAFSTNLNGYFETCMDTSTMYKRINGSWEKVSTELPGKGLYYLNNKFVGYGMCDVVVCTELPKPYTIQLVEYKKVGEKAPPSDSGSTANTLPVYQTVSLSGDVKIDIQYFSDKNCQNKKTFSTVIKR